MKKQIVILFILLAHLSYAQTLNRLFEMMDDQSINYYDVKKYAEDYFSKNGTGHGTGHNQYKRWEYEMQFWIDQQGNRIDPRSVAEAAKKFDEENASVTTQGSAPW